MEEKSEKQRAVRRAQIRGMRAAVEIVLAHDCGTQWNCDCIDVIARDIEKAIERKRGLDN